MIVTLVTFPTPESSADPRDLIKAAAPRYRNISGLNRKYFIGNETVAGGLYEWHDRSSAERFFDQAWHKEMAARYGSVPEVVYFDAPCLVDNVVKQIISSDRAAPGDHS